MLAAWSARRLRSSLARSVAWLASRSVRAWRSPSRAPSRASAALATLSCMMLKLAAIAPSSSPGVHDDRHHVHAGVGGVEIADAERLNGADQIGQRTGGQAVGRAGDLFRGVGDHAWQDQAHAHRQQRDGHEDVLEGRDERGLLVVHVVDREQVAGPVERHHQEHGPGQFQMQRRRHAGQARATAIGQAAQRVQAGARVAQHEPDDDGGQAELLEAEQAGDAPGAAPRAGRVEWCPAAHDTGAAGAAHRVAAATRRRWAARSRSGRRDWPRR